MNLFTDNFFNALFHQISAHLWRASSFALLAFQQKKLEAKNILKHDEYCSQTVKISVCIDCLDNRVNDEDLQTSDHRFKYLSATHYMGSESYVFRDEQKCFTHLLPHHYIYM